MNRKILRFTLCSTAPVGAPRRKLLGFCLLASGALACSSSKGESPPATETNVTMPSTLGNDNNSNNTGPLEYVTTGNDTAACQTATFCDGFEGAAPSQAPMSPWSAVQTNGSVVVDTTHAFRGTQSVKATTLATAVSGATYKRALLGFSGAPVIPVQGDAFYGRMMFYLESVPQTALHWTFIDGSGTIPGQNYSSTYRYGGQLPVTDGGTFKGSQFMANYDTNDFYGTPPRGPNTDCYQHADSKVVPVGKWSCAEWFFDGQNNQMKFWLDGTELTAIDINGKGAGCSGADAKAVPDYPWQGPTFSRIDVGWESYAADDERTIWIDDVVISPTQVGCPERAAAAAPATSPNPSGY